MKIIDGESYDRLLLSMASILDVDPYSIKTELCQQPDNLTENEFIERFYKSKFYKNCNHNYDGIYLFHLTRCTDEMLKNIEEKGLLPPQEAIKYIENDIINHFDIMTLKQTLLSIDDYKLKRNPVDNNIYAMSVNINEEKFKEIDKSQDYQFLDKKRGPEYVRDIINELQQKGFNNINYFDFTKPYIIKVFVYADNLEKLDKNFLKKIKISLQEYYLLYYLYILYIIFKNITTKNNTIILSAFVCNENIIDKIIEVEDERYE